MTYRQAIDKINSLLRFGSRPGLDRITKLLQLLGNPHKGLSCVHVAGTNGKGSVCALLSSVLKNAGYKRACLFPRTWSIFGSAYRSTAV